MSGVVNEFNTGRDCSVVIIHPLAPNGRLDIPLVTDFDAKPKYHDITVNGLDGYTRTEHVIQNIDLSFGLDRSDPAVDTFCWAMVGAYRTAGRVPKGSVFHYTAEIDGSQTTINYTSVAFKVDDLGSWKKDSAVSQKLMGTAMEGKRL